MAGLRRSLSSGVSAGLLGWLCVSGVRADHCHRPPLDSGSARGQNEHDAGVRVEARALFASFDIERDRGRYEGLSLTGGWWAGPWRAEASFPVYRLVKNGMVERGPGDALIAVALAVWKSKPLTLGVEAAGTLPFGDADAELGMGHVMLLPSAWASLDLGGTALSGRLGYAAAVGGNTEQHAHHTHHTDETDQTDGTGPLVAPMNRHEVGAALFVRQSLLDSVGVQFGADLAIPTGEGQSRSIVSGSVLLDAGAFDSLVGLELPLLGNPFTARANVALAVRW